MAGTLTRGYTFGATEEVTAAKLHALIDDGTISGITADDIASGTITDDKISSVSGSKLIGLANISSGSGVIPAANLTSVAQKGANSDITSLSSCTQITGMTTPLTTAQGGTGSTADANTANGIVVLDANSKITLPQFGAWASRSAGSTYQAATDGLVVAYTSNTTLAYVCGYSDSSSSPTTVRAISRCTISGTASASIFFPVKKNDYYLVSAAGGEGTPVVFFMPIGG